MQTITNRTSQVTVPEFDFDLDSLGPEIFDESISPVKMKTSATLTCRPLNQPQGSLSSRIRCIAHELEEGMGQADWRLRAVSHPAYALIEDELKAAYANGDLDAKMDTLESIGCIVTYERVSTKLTIGLSAEGVTRGFTEHSKLVDLRNKHLLDTINNVSPLDRFKEESVPTEIPRLSTTYYLTITLSE